MSTADTPVQATTRAADHADHADHAGLRFEDIGLVYNDGRPDRVQALAGLTLEVPRGQFVTVVGSNGAGKSSLVKIVAGAERPTYGRVLIDGTDVTRRPDWRRAGLVARVFDDPRLGTAPELSIEDNLALAISRGQRRTLRPASGRGRRQIMGEHLARLGLGLENRLREKVGSLSAGQRQSLTMVMAALAHPRVLLLDEHLAALDPATSRRVLDLTIELADDLGATTLMVTHNMDHAIELGDRLIVMGAGRVLADIDGEAKHALTPTAVVDLIVAEGGTVSDRTLLSRTEEIAR